MAKIIPAHYERIDSVICKWNTSTEQAVDGVLSEEFCHSG